MNCLFPSNQLWRWDVDRLCLHCSAVVCGWKRVKHAITYRTASPRCVSCKSDDLLLPFWSSFFHVKTDGGPEDKHVYTMLSRSASTLRENIVFIRCFLLSLCQVDITVGGTNYNSRTGLLKRTENNPSVVHLGFFVTLSPVHQTCTEPWPQNRVTY